MMRISGKLSGHDVLNGDIGKLAGLCNSRTILFNLLNTVSPSNDILGKGKCVGSTCHKHYCKNAFIGLGSRSLLP